MKPQEMMKKQLEGLKDQLARAVKTKDTALIVPLSLHIINGLIEQCDDDSFWIDDETD